MKRSPQEKKALSLKKDRRNTYGENSKSSRKVIPLRKAQVNRANRRAAESALASAKNQDLDVTDAKLNGRREKTWRKWPDQPLGVVLEQRKGRKGRTAE